ncbi:membrane associated ring-CH-type finger 4b [Syngnathoides biaculeatus]|uniref:membrane associated ring-CH-type finger 4b n=1 Tax=Syngnathoides biaculeatus TaxID=300417 RepID=UPI002ADD8F94|nr:membrane associated ring-CH-type finger 4b [Syngnathoides biaculeatus]XP_061698025.1 membrane associated ring-CH-type finger 4b [Syngnathoides biaculeatus]
MLRGRGMLKSRCCVLLGDLRLLLLGPPMSGQATQSREPGVAERGTPPAATAASAGAERGPAVPGWVDAAELSAALRGCSSSSDDCSKGKLEERFSLTSYTESGFRTPVCRICFQGPEHGELLSPCRCSGSVRCTHQPCLIKWISERGSWACELCYYKYQVIAISTKNPLQWQAISLTVIEKVQIAAAILGSLFLMASISWLVWSSFSPSARWQRQDLLFQICYGMYGFMDVVCIALIVHEGPSVFRIFHRWQAVNQQWKVLNYDKSMDNVDLKDVAADRTHQPGPAYQAGLGVSPSTSSLMAVASTAAGSTSTTVVAAAVAGGPGAGVNADGSAVGDPHCPYNLLHLLSHLRPSEPRGPANGNARELVMRVTTV